MKKRILIADDDPGWIELIDEQLNIQYDTFRAEDGLKALDKIIRIHPDLIILDVRMSPASGVSLFEHLRMSQDLSSIPTIFVTAYDDELSELKAKKLGAVAYLKKPIKIQELKELVDKILK